jgi:hypothetical protein
MGKTMKCLSLILAGVLSASVSSAQTEPPPNGTTTVALEGSIKTFYRAVNTIIVTTIDGAEHVYHFTKDLVVYGGKGPAIDALEGLRTGTTVVIHYSTIGDERTVSEIDRVGDQGLETTEGMVTRIDRGRKRITVRISSQRTETFQLTDRAFSELSAEIGNARAGTMNVVIYFLAENGQKVAHYFKRIS